MQSWKNNLLNLNSTIINSRSFKKNNNLNINNNLLNSNLSNNNANLKAVKENRLKAFYRSNNA